MDSSAGEGKPQNAIPECAPILIVGIGNILFSDEGVGVHVIKAMQKLYLPDVIELLDAGTAVLSFLDSLSGREKVIIIDAVKGNNKPGTIYRFTPADISLHRDIPTSLHQIGIIDSLTMLEFIGKRPQEVVIFGVEPAILDWGLDLSPEVADVLPKLLHRICQELKIPSYQSYKRLAI
jgi:hydrogenase maturation protease